ncbi:MAG: ABC transporter substrate-binding protein, partial [Thermoprotei archaeon]
MRSKRLLGLLFAIAVVAWMTAGSALRALPPASASPEAAEVPYGPWVDEVVFFSEKDLAKAVDMMEKGDMHLYFIDISDPDLFARVKASPNLKYKFAYGLYNELTFNPVGPEFKNGEFNPFCNPRIREAMNYIIDRNYIVNEIYKGLAKPKWVPLISAFPEYGRLADVIKLLEARYKYDFEKGKNIIFEELTKMGCEYREGKWYYKGKPIVIKFLIRIEDQRKQIGDYV